MQSFLSIFCDKYGVSPDLVSLLLSRMEKRTFGRHEMVVGVQERQQNYYIIVEGVWRGYSILDGEERTLWFERYGDILYSEVSKDYIIESISDSSAYVISKVELDAFCVESHEISNVIRRVLEQYYFEITRWLIMLCQPTARQRYLTVLQSDPEVFQMVPQKYIASCLGMTPQSLSRIRRQIVK
ncbi:Crp/Fnr family transcriptional regulator [Flavobacterium sp. HSC-61S13]|uniref:Crp/Fnr family transcriptional regulator n=1 Tax=Flavobacterium sp. HSC-61S13 TaxID=2910963 RepID=UPI0020A1FB0C|nr:Crp/Fnr family transcriptional regulator [Flavobacterium sp. HSC-61S13]MCP1995458.1 CRP-like cAMP-binding protein [Flavobacterium sp. HSC-61S13]